MHRLSDDDHRSSDLTDGQMSDVHEDFSCEETLDSCRLISLRLYLLARLFCFFVYLIKRSVVISFSGMELIIQYPVLQYLVSEMVRGM